MKMRKVAIIDYEVGNIASHVNALAYLGAKSVLTSKEEELAKCDAIILPGVGAFEEAVKSIKLRELDQVLEHLVIKKSVPILGVCLGMQLLAGTSEENGLHKGLGWIPGSSVKHIPVGTALRVPHVGWDAVEFRPDDPLFGRFKQGEKVDFYFDHSYQFHCDEKYVTSSCSYGGKITASVRKEHIWGVQFHPERSHVAGLKLLKSFLTH